MKDTINTQKRYLFASDFDQTLLQIQEWDKVQTDFLTFRRNTAVKAARTAKAGASMEVSNV